MAKKNGNGTVLRKKFFGRRKTGVVAVVEVGCMYGGKPKQAQKSAEYIRFLLEAYCQVDIDVYSGIAYWGAPRNEGSVEEDMERFDTSFAIHHLHLPEGTMDSVDNSVRAFLNTAARKRRVIKRTELLRDRKAYELIVDEESRQNSAYSNLRGEIAYQASRQILTSALNESGLEFRIMECSIPKRTIKIDGRDIVVAQNGQIDIVMTFPSYTGLKRLLAKMKHYPHIGIIDRTP